MNDQRGEYSRPGRHRRARGGVAVQATFPTFRLRAAPPVTAGFGMPIGRVGALAVALGVGFAVGIGHGAGTAHADDTSTKTESTDSSSSESASSSKDSTSSKDAASTSTESAPEPEPQESAIGDADTSDPDAEQANDGTPGTETDEPTEEPAPTDDTTGDDATEEPTKDAEPTRPTDNRTFTEPTITNSFPRHAAETITAPAASVLPQIATTLPETGAPTLRLVNAAADAAATATACAACSGAHAKLPTPIEVLVAPVVAVHTVLGIAQKLLAAFLNPPNGSAQPGLLWVALAWARREIEHTFFNRTPRVDDQEIALTLAPGDSSVPIGLGATDREGDALTYRIPTTGDRAPEHGTVTFDQAAGTFVYIPTDPEYTGTDIFTVTVSDRGFHLHGPLSWMFKNHHGHTDTAVITIHLNPDSTPSTTITPIVHADTLTTTEDTRGTGNVLTNDSVETNGTTVPGAGSLIAALTVGAAHGQVVLHDDGTYTYTPEADYNGTDSFTYTATTIGTGGGASATATVTVIVTPVNDAPTGLAGQYGFGAEDTAFGGQLLAADIDSPATAFGYAVSGQAQHGSVTVSSTGIWSYTPAANYAGTDSFTFTVNDGQGASTPVTVSVSVAPVDDPPTGMPGQAGIGAEDTTFGGQLLATDIDSSAGALRYALGTQAARGTVTVNANGSWTYTPVANFNGSDSFTFIVSDGANASAPARVTLTLTPAYDPPTGNPASAAGDEDHDISGLLSATGGDADLTYTVESSPTHGSVTVDPTGSWTFTPDPDFNGDDSFTYTVDDGRNISAPATVTITVHPVNDSPTAQAGTHTATEDGVSVTGSFDFADVDLDDPTPDQVSVTVTQPAGGTVSLHPNGTGYTYTPKPDFSGVDTFTYTVTDTAGARSTAAITVTVTAVNDRPVATPGLAGTIVEDSVNGTGGTLAGTDTDFDTVKYNLNVQAEHGFVTVDENTGAWTYTPHANYSGADTFTFTVNDGTLISAPAEVTVHVTGVNDAPVTGGDISQSTDEDAALTISRAALTANVTDADGDALTITGVGAPGHGTVTVDLDGSFVYRPDADFHGVDSFTYTVSDGLGGSSTASVTVAVASIPDAPVANPDGITADGGSTTINAADLLANDTDGDGDGLIAIIVDDPTNGSLIDNGDGTFTYIPDDGFSGPDSFTYMASDGTQVSPTTVVTITVAAVIAVL